MQNECKVNHNEKQKRQTYNKSNRQSHYISSDLILNKMMWKFINPILWSHLYGIHACCACARYICHMLIPHESWFINYAVFCKIQCYRMNPTTIQMYYNCRPLSHRGGLQACRLLMTGCSHSSMLACLELQMLSQTLCLTAFPLLGSYFKMPIYPAQY